MERILTILRVLDHSKNAIFLVSTETVSANGGNEKAKILFGLGPEQVNLETILGADFSPDKFMDTVIPALMEKDRCLIKNTDVTSSEGEPIPCDLEFVLATDDMEYVFLIVRIKEDRRPVYLDMLLQKSKDPTFILDYSEHLIVKDGNELFYNSFACTKENIDEKYQSLFDNFLAEETKTEYIEKITAAIPENPSGILDIPVKTSHGDTLYFYYNTKKIKPLIEPHEKCVFCKLINPADSLTKVEFPFDKNHRPEPL